MSSTPHPTDVEVSRALNALVVTLNDWRLEAPSREQLQRIVTGAVGGEEKIAVAAGDGGPAQLADRDGRVLARIERRGGRWIGARVGPPSAAARAR